MRGIKKLLETRRKIERFQDPGEGLKIKFKNIGEELKDFRIQEKD